MVTSKRGEIFLGGLLVAAGLMAALYWIPKIEVFGWDQVLHPQKISPAFYKRDVFAQEDRARQTLATILGGLAVLAGAGLTLRNVRAAEKSAEIARDNAETARRVAEQNAETAQKNIKIAEDKQITDRFTSAVTNLSADDKMAQRLGGIYALERIARDSPEDHWTVMEVLTAYVRDKRPLIDSEEVNANHPEGPRFVGLVTPTDIQAILTVIGRRDGEQDKGQKLDLHEVNLYKADLLGAKLGEATLSGADLRGANLDSVDLVEANLGGGNLRGANLVRANLVRADLRGAYMQGAKLVGADLRGAYMQGANLWGVDLGGVDLGGGHLYQADLRKAKLGGATLYKADLREADLREAKLEEADLADCRNLIQQQLDSADQTEAPFALPPGLTFPGYSAPKPPTAPPAPPVTSPA